MKRNEAEEEEEEEEGNYWKDGKRKTVERIDERRGMH